MEIIMFCKRIISTLLGLTVLNICCMERTKVVTAEISICRPIAESYTMPTVPMQQFQTIHHLPQMEIYHPMPAALHCQLQALASVPLAPSQVVVVAETESSAPLTQASVENVSIVSGQSNFTDERSIPKSYAPRLQPTLYNSPLIQPKPFEGTLKFTDRSTQKVQPITIPLSETKADFAQSIRSQFLQDGGSPIDSIVIYNQDARNFKMRSDEILNQLPSASSGQTMHPADFEALTNQFEALAHETEQYSDLLHGTCIEAQAVASWQQFHLTQLKSQLAQVADTLNNPLQCPSDRFLKQMTISRFKTAEVKKIMGDSPARIDFLRNHNQLWLPLGDLKADKLRIETNIQKLEQAALADPKNHVLQEDIRRAMWDLKNQHAHVVCKLTGEEQFASAEKWLQANYALLPSEQRHEAKVELEADLQKALKTLSHSGLSERDKSLAFRAENCAEAKLAAIERWEKEVQLSPSVEKDIASQESTKQTETLPLPANATVDQLFAKCQTDCESAELKLMDIKVNLENSKTALSEDQQQLLAALNEPIITVDKIESTNAQKELSIQMLDLVATSTKNAVDAAQQGNNARAADWVGFRNTLKELRPLALQWYETTLKKDPAFRFGVGIVKGTYHNIAGTCNAIAHPIETIKNIEQVLIKLDAFADRLVLADPEAWSKVHQSIQKFIDLPIEDKAEFFGEVYANLVVAPALTTKIVTVGVQAADVVGALEVVDKAAKSAKGAAANLAAKASEALSTEEKAAATAEGMEFAVEGAKELGTENAAAEGLATDLFEAKTMSNGISKTEKIHWTCHDHKHFPPKNVAWKEIVKSTKVGDAKYHPNVDIEKLERFAWENGTMCTNGKSWKVMKFNTIVGAKEGVETNCIRIEYSANTIHGHPITPAEYAKLIK